MQSWKDIQVQTLTRWCNKHLFPLGYSIDSLHTDFSDGLKLAALVQVLSQKTIPGIKRNPTSRILKLENAALILRFLEHENVNLIGIGNEDIVDSNGHLILRLTWQLIQHYSICNEKVNGHVDDNQNQTQSPERRLMQWINNIIPSVPIWNFTTDWNDGRAIGALVNTMSPGLCSDWKCWKSFDALQNVKKAMDQAQAWFNVEQLLTPKDLINPGIDKICMMTYLSQFCNCVIKEVPNPPGTPTVHSIGATELEVTWTEPITNTTDCQRGYVVEYKEACSSSWMIWEDLITNTTVILSGLPPYQEYQVRVSIFYEIGIGPVSQPSDAVSTRNKLDLAYVELILQESKPRLCKFLEPSNILRTLRSKDVLTDDELAGIRHSPRIADRVQRMLQILKGRPVDGYPSLMEALRKDRYDLFVDLLLIESKYIFGYEDESVTQDSRNLFPLHDDQHEPIVTVRRKPNGGRVARLHYPLDSGEKTTRERISNTPTSASDSQQFNEVENAVSARDHNNVTNTSEDTEELHIRADIRGNAEWEVQKELNLRIFLQIPKPEYLSNIVNNVFGSHGGVLSWFETGSLYFHVRSCSAGSLDRITKSVENGRIAEQLSRILLNEEVLGEGVTGVYFRAEIDDDDTNREVHVPGSPGQPHLYPDESNNVTTLSWHPPVSVESYKGIGYVAEYQAVRSDLWKRINDIPVLETMLKIQGLNCMAEHRFRVFAETTSGRGPASEISDKYRCPPGNWISNDLFPREFGPGTLRTPLGISLSHTGDVAVADYNTQQVKIYNDKWNLKTIINTKQVSKRLEDARPWQVAANSEGIYFVTDRTHCVKVYDVNGTFKCHFPAVSPEGFDSNSAFSQLCGLTVDSKDHVLVGEWFDMYISKHASDGTHLNSIRVNISPYHLAVTPDDSIVVGSLNAVAILDSTGNPLHILNSAALPEWKPRGICCSKDTIVVANYSKACSGIVCFSVSGVYQGFIKTGDRPWSQVVSDDGKTMLVTVSSGVDVLIKK